MTSREHSPAVCLGAQSREQLQGRWLAGGGPRLGHGRLKGTPPARGRVCLALFILPCAALRCAALRCAALRCAALRCHAMPCHAMPCHAMPCPALSCHAMPCHALPCHAMPLPLHCDETGEGSENARRRASSKCFDKQLAHLPHRLLSAWKSISVGTFAAVAALALSPHRDG